MNLPQVDALDLTGVRATVDEQGNAFVEVEDLSDPAAWSTEGIWYRGRDGALVDNLRYGSQPWTAEVAERALQAAGL